MPQTTLAVFDMDGTILDTLQDLTTGVNLALADFGMPARGIDEVRQFVGNGAAKLIERAVPEGTPENVRKEVLKSFREHYGRHSEDTTRPYDGVSELIVALRAAGIRTAVVSNKPGFAVRQLAEKYFHGLFDIAVGDAEGRERKPAPDSVNEVMRRLSASREQTVYIGDSDVDADTARNAGVRFIGVEWGFRSREVLAAHGATVTVKTPKEISDALLGSGEGDSQGGAS